jgi:LPS sulfotransferase NodH
VVLSKKSRYDMKNFIIISEARTGGTHVVSMLDSHPNIKCVSEPFAHLQLDTPKKQFDWISEFNEDLKKGICCGFRTKINQIADPSAFVRRAQDEDWSIFDMERTHVVKRAVSRVRAKELYDKSGDYNVKIRKGMSPLGKTPINIKRLLKEIALVEKEIRHSESFFASYPDLSYTKLTYEALLSDEVAFFRELQVQIGVDFIDLTPIVQKNTSDKLSESISNMDELREALKETNYYSSVLQE